MTTNVSNPTEVKLFHQILFWPLRLIPSHRQATSQEEFAKTLQDQLKGSPWQKHADLYDRGTASDEITRYAEFVYFHPFIRQFLYGRKGKHDAMLQLFRRDDVEQVEVVLSKDKTYQFKVERLHLYTFDIKVAILVMEISSPLPLPLADVQNCLDYFRRVYPPYWAYWDDKCHPGHSPQTVTLYGKDHQSLVKGVYNESDKFLKFAKEHQESPVAEHWEYLLKPFAPYQSSQLKNGKICYQQIEDERIPYMAYLAFEDPCSLTRGDMMRLAFADDQGRSETLPYSSSFSQNFERDYCYNRYWETDSKYQDKHDWMNTRYLCCGYAFTIIGENAGMFADGKTGILAHFRHHYFQMGLIAHFHKAALLMLWADLAEAVAKFNKDSQSRQQFREEVREILERLLHFTHRYWFTEVSNQVQAKELFNWWSNHLGSRELFERVMNEAKEAHQFLEMEEQRRQTETTTRLTVVATVGLVVGLTLTVSTDLSMTTTWLALFGFAAGATTIMCFLKKGWLKGD